jgi:hypothetical protein
MNKNDPEYQIVVAMSETLVPDVCGVIMGFLDDIHIKEGETRWKKKIKDVNAQYHSLFIVSPDRHVLVTTMGFQYNWRNWKTFSFEFGAIYSQRCKRFPQLSHNYYYTKLW